MMRIGSNINTKYFKQKDYYNIKTLSSNVKTNKVLNQFKVTITVCFYMFLNLIKILARIFIVKIKTFLKHFDVNCLQKQGLNLQS